METITISGFSLSEVGLGSQLTHWLRGGFPPSFLATTDADSLAWRQGFIQTLLEHDLPMLGVGAQPAMLRRFWTMLAHYQGQVWNAAELARALDIGETTTRRYLEMLEGVFLIRILRPWHANLLKRQVKSPKVYFRDTGLLHALLGIYTQKDLLTHPRYGASWEGYAIEEVLLAIQPDDTYFWATHGGAELDLLMLKDGQRIGVECKRIDAPRLTPSMRIALQDLELDRLIVIYPGLQHFSLHERIEAIPLTEIAIPNSARPLI